MILVQWIGIFLGLSLRISVRQGYETVKRRPILFNSLYKLNFEYKSLPNNRTFNKQHLQLFIHHEDLKQTFYSLSQKISVSILATEENFAVFSTPCFF